MLSRQLAMAAVPLVALSLVSIVPETPAHARPQAQTTHEVTLLTGDKVIYADGQAQVVAADRPGGEPVTFATEKRGGGYYVIPSDARRYLDAGRLDHELFNVKGLISQGLADNTTNALPVIVTRAERARAAADLPGTTGKTRPLPSVNGTALKVDRQSAAAFWAALDQPGTRSLAQQVTKVWLDRRLKPVLDVSVPQVGAPHAWQAGYDGAGVTVAVLDTGIDAQHPDVAGKVAEARSFVEGVPDPMDYNGHGTHVASTIAGTGAASGGKYKGVAPGARLVNGKVCEIYCETSAILEAMDWAARSGAKVINMSLGMYTLDESDLMSERVDELTRETGVLFVVAAGNSDTGDVCSPCASTPGIAKEALTVGAVDKSDKLAWFSFRGPRRGDAGVKPEITAPGVAITAARAAGTLPDYPGDEHYVAISGTSMATPHVAGAAALLAQARPDAKPAELKDTLTSTAKDVGAKVFEQGAGRLDLVAALKPVSGPASLNLGTSDTTRTATYTNRGDAPVTLRLGLTAASWDGRATDDVTLPAAELTVPAHGRASVDVRLDAGDHGVFGGLLTATADGVSLRTPLSWYRPYPAKPMHPLTVKMLDHAGDPLAKAYFSVIRDAVTAEDTPNDPFHLGEYSYYAEPTARGTWVAQVPDGSYSVLGHTSVLRPDRIRATVLAATNINVTGAAAEVTIDARTAVPAKAQVRGPSYTYNHQMTMSMSTKEGYGVIGNVSVGNLQHAEIYATPVAAPARGHLGIQETYTIGQQSVHASARLGRERVELHPQYEPFRVARKLTGEHRLPVVADLGADVKGKAVLVRLAVPDTDTWSSDLAQQVEAIAEKALKAGAAAILPYLDAPGATPFGTYAMGLRATPMPVLSLGNAEGERLRNALGNGPVTLDLRVLANPGHMYSLNYAPPFGIPANLTHRVDLGRMKKIRTRYHADVPGLALQAWNFAWATDRGLSLITPQVALQAPVELDVYLEGFGGNQRWRRDASLSNGTHRFTQLDFEPYRGHRESWFAGPLSMTDPGTGFFRWKHPSGLDIFTASPYLGDSAAGHFVDIDAGNVYPFTYRLFHGQTEIEPKGSLYGHTPFYDLPDEEGEYRLEGTFRLPSQGFYAPTDKVRKMSPRVDNVWTFRSKPPTGKNCGGEDICEVPPILQLRYDLGADLTNHARAGLPHVIQVTAASPQAKIAGLTLQYSTDEGATWRKAGAIPLGGGRYTAILVHGKGSSVWLKTEAWDEAGNRITQTVQRAYGLR